MSERKIIADKIRRKTNEIANLEEKIKAAKVYLKALNDITSLLEKDEEADGGLETKLRKGSLVYQAREIILQRAEPVHLDDLLREMGKEVTRDAKGSLNGSLSAYVRDEDIFVRTAPATYGLLELSHAPADIDEEEEGQGPPDGFGQEPVVKSSNYDDLDEDIPF